jgi:hypothetical protein
MLQLNCHDMGGNLCAHVRPCLESAAQSLDLAADFISFEIHLEHFPDSEEAWLQLESAADPAESRMKGLLFCSENCFYGSTPSRNTVFPPAEIWDQAPAPAAHAPFDSSRFSQSSAEIFLHHELLMARDLVRREVVPAAIASGQVEAFSAVWAVVIDGRLARMGLPGYSIAERRSRFSRLFACAGVLLPGHWQIFQALWDGGVVTSKEVIASIRLLPRL